MLWIQMYIDFSFFDTWKSEEDEAIQTKHMFSEIPGLKIPGRCLCCLKYFRHHVPRMGG